MEHWPVILALVSVRWHVGKVNRVWVSSKNETASFLAQEDLLLLGVVKMGTEREVALASEHLTQPCASCRRGLE
jgi:hypothetical protein